MYKEVKEPFQSFSGDVDPKADAYLERRGPLASSSPSASLASSPIVSALQNRTNSSQRANRTTAVYHRAAPQTPKHCGGTIAPVVVANSPTPHFPVIRGIQLVPVHRLPDHLRAIFDFELFNAVQSKCFATAYESDDNIVISAPTGSGKTAIMEIALCRLMERNHDFKTVYQAPTKSLCNERYRDWTSRFGTLGLQCAELTGDADHTHLRSVQSAQIIITTPEKWDSVTRKWKDNAELMRMIKLFLVDEVHILRESRGATLEAVISRMKSVGSAVRLIALSATVPNSEDIATWLGRNPMSQHLSAYREVFDESFRPVKLEKHVIGYRCNPNTFALDSMLTKEICAVLDHFSNNKPAMVFCVTKIAAMKTATVLAEHRLSNFHAQSRHTQRRQIMIVDPELLKVMSARVAFHHSGLEYSDRRAVERGFMEGTIDIICSTSTLAVGVNLPCYLVVLKGTSSWSDNGWQEYSSLDVMQMLGRAGRPQYEKSACAVILTHNEKVSHYQKMVSGEEILESALHRNLIEHLNAEIGIGTVSDVNSAKRWLNSSFLSVRLRQNPGFYQLDGYDAATIGKDQLLEQICQRDLDLLESAQLVESKNGLRCTEYGNAMARYYMQFKTMLVFMGLPPRPRIPDILDVIAQAHEFANFRLRAGEKSMYKKINSSNDTRYPVKVNLALPSHKVSLVIQAQLGGIGLDESHKKYASQFKQDSLMVMSHCNRLIRCIIDLQVHRGDATGVKNALELCRSLTAGVWDNTPMQLKQIESIGEVTARKLAAAGINTIETLLNTEPQRIEVVMGKSQPFGRTLLKKAACCPTLRISVKKMDEIRKTGVGVKVQLKCEIGFLGGASPTYFNRRAIYVCFLCETSAGKLVDFRRFSANRLQKGEDLLLTALLDGPCDSIRCHVMCDEIAGTHRYAALMLNIPPAAFLRKNDSQKIEDNTVEGQRTKMTRDFDDAGIADDDLLMAESKGGNVEDHDRDIGPAPVERRHELNDTENRTCKASTSIKAITTAGDVQVGSGHDDVFEFEDDWLSAADCDWSVPVASAGVDLFKPSAKSSSSDPTSRVDRFVFEDDIEAIDLTDLDAAPGEAPNSGKKPISNLDPPTPETQAQREKRLHEDGQKRKWAALPDWMYEEYGSVIELV